MSTRRARPLFMRAGRHHLPRSLAVAAALLVPLLLAGCLSDDRTQESTQPAPDEPLTRETPETSNAVPPEAGQPVHEPPPVQNATEPVPDPPTAPETEEPTDDPPLEPTATG